MAIFFQWDDVYWSQYKISFGGDINMSTETSSQDFAIKRWCFFVVFWPLLCFVFAGIIVCQSGLEIEKRVAGAGFAVIPLIFFAVGMSIRRRLLKERRYATAFTMATVVSIKHSPMMSGGNKSAYFPIYEFQIEEKKYHVKSPSGYSSSCVSKGQQVELYYNPKDPLLFYVPIMQKRDNRWAVLLCGIGIVYPIVGLVHILSLL